MMTEERPDHPDPAVKAAARAARRDRLAAELRANLRRRKAQGRARATAGPDPADTADPGPSGTPRGD